MRTVGQNKGSKCSHLLFQGSSQPLLSHFWDNRAFWQTGTALRSVLPCTLAFILSCEELYTTAKSSCEMSVGPSSRALGCMGSPPISFWKALVLLRNIWKQSHTMPGGQEEQGMYFFGSCYASQARGYEWQNKKESSRWMQYFLLCATGQKPYSAGPTNPRGTRSAQTVCQ